MRTLLATVLLISLPTMGAHTESPLAPTRPPEMAAPRPGPTRSPIVFEANAGQFAASAAFVARGSGGEVTFGRRGEIAVGGQPMTLVGGRRVAPRGEQPTGAAIRYLHGKDPQGWMLKVASYRGVSLPGVYPGIDWIWHSESGAIEYDFVVQPGADPRRIELSFGRAARLRIVDGDLVVTGPEKTAVHRRPTAYQELAGVRHPVLAGWRITGGRARFSLGSYDSAVPLVIDPLLAWSAYLGGPTDDAVSDVVVGPDGSVFVCGYVDYSGFPRYDAFVSRFTPGGALVYTTVFGGITADYCGALAIDGTGRLFLAGTTYSNDFPVVNAAQPAFGGDRDGVAMAFAPDGSVVFSTYAGAVAVDDLRSLTVAPDGSVWMAGSSFGQDFPAKSAYQPTTGGYIGFYGTPVIQHFLRDGELLLSSYAIANSGAESLFGNAIAAAADGSLYVVPSPSPGGGPSSPMRLIKINPSSGVVWTRSYGTGYLDALAIGADQTVWASGTATRLTTTSPDAYDSTCGTGASCNGTSDAVLIAVDGAGAQLYATYLGGSGTEQSTHMRISGAGSIWLHGYTGSADWPESPPPGDNTHVDGFVVRFSVAARQVTYAVRYPGNSAESPGGIAPDAQDGAYIAGLTSSTNLPNALNTPKGNIDGFLAYFAPLANLITIDRPLNGATVFTEFDIAGWGIDDRSASGSGFDAIHAWAFPIAPTGMPMFLGVAQLGVSRPDVAAAFGSRYASSGYGLDVFLPAGRYLIGVYGRATATGAFDAVRTTTVTVVDSTRITIDAPANGATLASPFQVGGWAIDFAAPGTVGTGVDAVHVWAYPATGGSAMWVGAAEYGVDRPDVAAVYGARFRFSGYNVNGAALPPGRYTLVAYPYRVATGSFGLPVLTSIEIVGPSIAASR